MKEMVFLSTVELSKRIQRGEITAAQALDAQLRHIRRFNDSVNALVTIDEEAARRRADEADRATKEGVKWGPLHGVAVTLKDAFETENLRTTSGWPRLSENVPDADSQVAARLRAAGAIILGKSNLPQLSDGPQTINRLFGRTNNPWNLDRTAGGSSGGSAAAVAAGLSRLDIGSDVSGSIRTPAHFCGVYGLKPTGGRVPIEGHISSLHSLALPEELLWMLLLPCPGPIARSIDDLVLCLSVISDPVPTPLVRRKETSQTQLRIAWTDELPGMPISRSTRQAIEAVAERLVAAGHVVSRVSAPGIDFDEAWELAGEVLGYLSSRFRPAPARALSWVASRGASMTLRGGGLPRGLMRGPGASRKRLRELADRRESLIRSIDSFLSEWDSWICPVFPTSAFPHCDRQAPVLVDEKAYIGQDTAEIAFNVVFNVSGHPSVTLPSGFYENGMPIGFQMIGHRWGDEDLLSAAMQLDKVVDGFAIPPGFDE